MTDAQKILKALKRQQVKEGHAKLILLHVRSKGLPEPIPEFIFHPTRKWRIDFAWPDYKLAVEIEGGIYQKDGGGHRSIAGFWANLEKYNELAIHGWFLIRLVPEWLELRSNVARDLLSSYFEKHGGKNPVEKEKEAEAITNGGTTSEHDKLRVLP